MVAAAPLLPSQQKLCCLQSDSDICCGY